MDETTRPSAREPDGEGPLSPRQVAAGRHLVQVHDQYRQEMEQVRDVLGRVRAGTQALGEARTAINTMTIRANDWTLGGICQAQCVALTGHHEMESGAIFGHLRDRRPDLAPVLERLDAEHLEIHELLEAVDTALVHLARNPTDYAPITAVVDRLSDTLFSHFSYEERELVGPLARLGFYPGQV